MLSRNNRGGGTRVITPKPLVNVIIPTYSSKRSEMLKEAVWSVEEQTYGQENIRIIISINGPDLAHKKTVENIYADIKNITCIYTPRSNAPAALNNAIRQVTDGYMCILDDDDYLTKGYIEELCSYIDNDIDVVFGRNAVQREDGSIDYDTYITKALRVAGQGKRKISAKEEILLNIDTAYLFNVHVVKNKFIPFDETLYYVYDTVYMVTNFGNINGYIYALPADGQEAYVIRQTENSLCRPSKEQEFTYWVVERIKILEKFTNVVFSARNSEHLKVAINYTYTVANSIYRYYSTLPIDDKVRALEYINACQTPFLDKAKFASQQSVENLENEHARLQNECARLQQHIIALQNNRSFRLGRFLTFLPRKIRDALRGKYGTNR